MSVSCDVTVTLVQGAQGRHCDAKADLRLLSWRSQSVHLLQCALPGWQDCASGAGAALVKVMGKMWLSEAWTRTLNKECV